MRGSKSLASIMGLRNCDLGAAAPGLDDTFPKFTEISYKWKKSVDDIIASAEEVELTEKT